MTLSSLKVQQYALRTEKETEKKKIRELNNSNEY